ncbi:MAG TPA: hypothetical protein VM364_23175 [Vicinamibacterales bacterium]|nr:hypothetical protein [Vicinamibacterales bacterium]
MRRVRPAGPTAAALIAVAGAWSTAAWLHRGVAAPFTAPAVAKLIASDAFLLLTGLAIVAAPLAGAAGTGPRRLVTALGAGLVASFAAAALAALVSGMPAGMLLRSHLALGAVTTALALVGMAARGVINDTLEAAAAALAVTLALASALLLAGPATDLLGERAIDLGLLANPLIAITSAAGFDLLRTDVLYQLSPIAHRRFTYPDWRLTLAAYGMVTLLCALIARRGALRRSA